MATAAYRDGPCEAASLELGVPLPLEPLLLGHRLAPDPLLVVGHVGGVHLLGVHPAGLDHRDGGEEQQQ